MGKKGGKGRREGASGTRDDEVIKVNSSWLTHGVNKLMLRQRKARQALCFFWEISQQEGGGGREASWGCVELQTLPPEFSSDLGDVETISQGLFL